MGNSIFIVSFSAEGDFVYGNLNSPQIVYFQLKRDHYENTLLIYENYIVFKLIVLMMIDFCYAISGNNRTF